MLKLVGLLLILASCSLFGFYKSLCLRKRALKLSAICISLEKAAQLVATNAGELNRIFSLSFEKDVLNFKGDTVVINLSFLQKNDIDLLENFFKESGMYDIKAEYNRIYTFKTIMEKEFCKAEKRAEELVKLYNTSGFLIGAFICIFLF